MSFQLPTGINIQDLVRLETSVLRQVFAQMGGADDETVYADLPSATAVIAGVAQEQREHGGEAHTQMGMMVQVSLKDEVKTVSALRAVILAMSQKESPRKMLHGRKVGESTHFRSRRVLQKVHVDRIHLLPERVERAQGPLLGLSPVKAVVDCCVVTTSKGKALQSLEGTPRLCYRIRWTGFPKSSDSWREASYLTGIAELVCAYHRSHALSTMIGLSFILRRCSVATSPLSWSILPS